MTVKAVELSMSEALDISEHLHLSILEIHICM